jgi:hypothetical protein
MFSRALLRSAPVASRSAVCTPVAARSLSLKSLFGVKSSENVALPPVDVAEEAPHVPGILQGPGGKRGEVRQPAWK